MQDSQINGTLQAGDGVKFYVDPTYEGESDGSKDSPYKDIQTALNNLDSNKSNTVYLKDGVYTGEANTKLSLIGNLILQADENAKPTIDGGQGNNFWTLTDSNILLKGITFTNFNRITNSNQGILTSSNIENLTVSGCTFENNTYARAMYLNHLNNTVIDGCTFQDNDIQSLSGGGVYAQYINNLTFSNNLAINQTSSYWYSGGLLYSSNNNNVTVVENRLFNVSAGSGSGVYSYQDKNVRFKNNLFEGVGTETRSNSGAAVYISNSKGEVGFIDNTVIINSKKSEYASVDIEVSNGGNVNVSDNDFINNTATTGCFICVYV